MTKVSDECVVSAHPKVSVILPVYNVKKYLDRCFESISSQTFTDFEVLAVDDGSTDGSGELCDEWAQKDKRIRVLHKQNGGLSDARNVGIDASCGEYITCIDSDDYVSTDYLETLLSLFQYAPGCTMVGAGHYVSRSSGDELDYQSDKEVNIFTRREAFVSVLYHGMVNVSAWAKMYHKSLFHQVKYPVGHLYEDTYVFGDLLNQTPAYVFSSKPVYYYCKRDDSIVSGGYKSSRLEFIDSVQHLTDAAMQCDSTLEKACDRRKMHACLSVLRYMKHVTDKDYELRDRLRLEALSLAKKVRTDPRVPRRDRLAVQSLKMGYRIFYLSWALYERIR